MKSVTPGAVDRLYEKLKIDKAGKTSPSQRPALDFRLQARLVGSRYSAHPTVVSSP